ncbi:SUMO-targeted ubiquitin ligase complex subunit slx8 [Xylographa trunciseda]|nr:SUMO-targeted ubiquitin ligase complex subunit slx8 [Xylographa trunciseda]
MPYPFYSMASFAQDSPYASSSPVPSRNSSGYIDLTADASPPSASSLPTMRRQSTIDRVEPTRKRRRLNTGNGPSIESLLQSPPRGLGDIDEVDLTKVDDDLGFQKLQEEQRLRQKEQQQAESIRSLHEQSKKPIRISDLQCVVCMDNMTNITATYCGHLFCHTCLMEALIAGENQGPDIGKGPSRCPVCRKKVVRPREGKDMNQLIPLELKLLTKSAVAKGKEKERESELQAPKYPFT